MNIGIDKIGFFVPPTALDMETLAVARGVEPAKYTIGSSSSHTRYRDFSRKCSFIDY